MFETLVMDRYHQPKSYANQVSKKQAPIKSNVSEKIVTLPIFSESNHFHIYQ